MFPEECCPIFAGPRLLHEGQTIGEVAKLLPVSLSTAKTHVAWVYEKLGASNRAQALMTAVRLGLKGPHRGGRGVHPPIQRLSRPAPAYRIAQWRACRSANSRGRAPAGMLSTAARGGTRVRSDSAAAGAC